MTDKEITKIVKEWVDKTKFPYGWEEGFLDACEDEEYRKENIQPLINNYLLWGQWEDWKNDKSK